MLREDKVAVIYGAGCRVFGGSGRFEVGRHGIQVVTLKTGGVPETLPDDFPGRAEIIAGLEQAALLNRTATLADVGHVAAFVASDRARTMTAADVNISCGAIVDSWLRRELQRCKSGATSWPPARSPRSRCGRCQ